jgi:hypothetical protein
MQEIIASHVCTRAHGYESVSQSLYPPYEICEAAIYIIRMTGGVLPPAIRLYDVIQIAVGVITAPPTAPSIGAPTLTRIGFAFFNPQHQMHGQACGGVDYGHTPVRVR